VADGDGSHNGKSRASAGRTAGEPKSERYLLRLYVAGVTTASSVAVSNLKLICEEHLKGRYELDVVDIYQQPTLAMSAQIVAVPTLIRKLPRPLRRIVGDMSQKERVLVGLDLLPRT
jgi:circadian clock protein KaiB